MIRLLTGDCRDVLKTLADESVHCVVTSPPYLGLRDYGTATWEGGDDPTCDHLMPPGGGTGASGLLGSCSQENVERKVEVRRLQYRDLCPRCGARRIDNQIGLEATPALYIANLVAVFAEVRRVLHPTGTVWLNLGDSYASGEVGRHDSVQGREIDGKRVTAKSTKRQQSKPDTGLPAKNLMMIPARVAIALQEDGWWLRSEIVWAKKAPMPESVTDRCTRSHEMVYMLTKSPRYFCDMEAVRQPLAESSVERLSQPTFDEQTGGPKDYGHRTNENRSARKALCNLKEKLVAQEKWGDRHEGWAQRDKSIGANLRDVWLLSPEPQKLAHFAVFPTELARRCIAMGSSEKGCCSVCGAPWERMTERTVGDDTSWAGVGAKNQAKIDQGMQGKTQTLNRGSKEDYYANQPRTTTLGWRPTCECNADVKPCVCLDPFAGSGTVGMVADRLGRDAILIDLNPEYSEMQRARVTADAPLFAEVTQ